MLAALEKYKAHLLTIFFYCNSDVVRTVGFAKVNLDVTGCEILLNVWHKSFIDIVFKGFAAVIIWAANSLQGYAILVIDIIYSLGR